MASLDEPGMQDQMASQVMAEIHALSDPASGPRTRIG